MTFAAYTFEDWVTLFKQTERELPATQAVDKTPAIESATFAKWIDHTLLKLDATAVQIDSLCKEAISHGFKVTAQF